MRVYLSWGNESNVDLIVTEPSGKVVNHSSSQGDNGSLIQNVDGSFGPKVYEVTCGQLKCGNYNIKLQHSSEVPTTANLLIRVRDNWYSKNIEFNKINEVAQIGIIQVSAGEVDFFPQSDSKCLDQSL